MSLLALGGCSADRPVPPASAHALARSLGIIRTATAEHPHVLRVLFYGQSITSPAWTDRAVTVLTRRYPNVRFVVRNMAIGGFSAVRLDRTAERDITAFYPDLIVFHVYGDHRAYEDIIRTIRSRTAADLVVQTDHIEAPIHPDCDEGLHLSLASRPGCHGRLWYQKADWASHMSWHVIPKLAVRYDFAVEPRRDEWLAYLTAKRLPYNRLLSDYVHPNDAGWKLTARLFTNWLDRAVAAWRGERGNQVRDLPPPGSTAPTQLMFAGNRVELIADRPLNGEVTVEVDGLSPAAIDGCWQNSRTSPTPGVPPWPVLRQVAVDPHLHEADTWTAVLTGFNADQSRFAYTLSSARHGADGAGTADQDFTSPSGRVGIKADDWMLKPALTLGQVHAPDGLKVRWRRAFVCRDQAPVQLTPSVAEYRYLVATGLSNGAHRLKLAISGEALSGVQSIRVYRPPLAKI